MDPAKSGSSCWIRFRSSRVGARDGATTGTGLAVSDSDSAAEGGPPERSEGKRKGEPIPHDQVELAPRAGLEPATLRLTAGCSAIELPRIEGRTAARAAGGRT